MTTDNTTSQWEIYADKLSKVIPWLAGAALLVPTSYFIWFSYHGLHVSTTPDNWGTFGDFTGGILNPMVAFVALLWLMISVGIQRTELKDTRKELAAAARAQEETAKHHTTMKYIEDCKTCAELNDQQMDKLLIRTTTSNGTEKTKEYLSVIEKASATTSKIDKDAFIKDYRGTLLDPLTGTLHELSLALTQWQDLHGNQTCYAVKYYKNKYYSLAGHLHKLDQIDKQTFNRMQPGTYIVKL